MQSCGLFNLLLFSYVHTKENCIRPSVIFGSDINDV
jgi:hypothetical protein